MRLIDAEEFKTAIKKYVDYTDKKYTDCDDYDFCFIKVKRLLEIIEEAPTIEAKPVVHCKDCKYNVANRQQDPLDINDYTDITCEYFMTDGMSPNDYCSQGRRVDNG